MGQSLECGCVGRPSEDKTDNAEPKAGLSSFALRSAKLPADLKNREGTLEEEWAIIKSSISEDEFQRLRELRDVVKHCDDHPSCRTQAFSQQPQTLLRFLRGREQNVQKAAIMFTNHLDWRQEFGVDEKVARWQAELAEGTSRKARLTRRFGVEVNLCDDKYDVPLRLIRLSVADSAGSVRELGPEQVLTDTLMKLEHTHQELRAAMFRHKALLRGQVQIIDVGDYGTVPDWSGRMFAAFRSGPDLFKVLDLNYPETVRKVLFIRLGFVSRGIWNRCLWLVPERTKRKLRLFGAEARDWVDELRAELKPGQALPAFLERDDAEAFATAIPRGGMFPTSEHDNSWDEDGNADGMMADKMVAALPQSLTIGSNGHSNGHVKTSNMWTAFILVIVVGAAWAAAQFGDEGFAIAVRTPGLGLR